MIMLNELKQGLDALVVEKKILENDLNVFNIIIKKILSSEVVNINGKEYFKADDIVKICQEGFKSLSSSIMKERGIKK